MQLSGKSALGRQKRVRSRESAYRVVAGKTTTLLERMGPLLGRKEGRGKKGLLHEIKGADAERVTLPVRRALL